MTIEKLIQQRLTSLAGGRVYGGLAPSPVARPYITHFHLGGELGMTFAGTDGSDGGSVQVDCWADTRADAVALAWEVKRLLDQQDGELAASNIRRLPSDYEADTKLFRASWEVEATTQTPT